MTAVLAAREIRSPWDGRVVGTVAETSHQAVEEAVGAAAAVRTELARLPAHRRAAALDHVSQRLVERASELADLLVAEAGKPLVWARAEVARAAGTFRLAAEEARRWSGELQRLDTDPASDGRLALVRRAPRGPVLAIAPFNFPLNLVAHKVAPALAVGCPVVLKPAPQTPLSALALGELLAETDLPAGSWSVLPVDNDAAAALVRDPRLPVVSFTGSGPVGWSICDAAPRKHVTLELGGNAAVVVAPDWGSQADLLWAATRCATFGMYQAGQSCVSVQRVLCAREHLSVFRSLLVDAVEALGTGAPADPATDVGPLVDEAAARRVQAWVDEAVRSGARLLTGGVRTGSTYAPDRARGGPRRCQGAGRGGLWTGGRAAGRRHGRRGVRLGQRLAVRAADRCLHPRRAAGLSCRERAGGRRGGGRRCAELPLRRDAVRRRQGLRARARGRPGGDARPY